MDNAVISGVYTSFRHIKTRKVVVLEIEIVEERFQEVITKLGMPIGGESKHVAIALLNNPENSYSHPEKSEGERLRIRAVMLCEDESFKEFATILYGYSICDKKDMEGYAKQVIYLHCDIKSRAELANNIEAQRKFKELDQKFKDWQFEQNHADNLGRF